MMAETAEAPPKTSSGFRKWLVVAGVAVVAVAAIGGGWYFTRGHGVSAEHDSRGPRGSSTSSDVHVELAKPHRGLLERKTTQPGNAIAWQSIDVLSEATGYIEKQTVDIGSVVKAGDLLVKIRVPDLKAQLEKQEAALELTRAQVEQAKAAVESARADLSAASEMIGEAEAKRKSYKAALTFRDKQRKRYNELLSLKSIDARLVDEQEDRYEAAYDTYLAGEASVKTANARKEAAKARVDQAKADLKAAERRVGVARGERDFAKSQVDFATINAPFDGVITKRNFFPGDFVHAATGSSQMSYLLTLQDTRTMRIVVPVPDRDVPYCNDGDEATVAFDALPGKEYKLTVSRFAKSEDTQTKTMRCEIDVPNTDGRIRQGMYGSVTIILDRVSDALTVPASALSGREAGGKASVYVVRDNKAHRVPVRTGLDNGVSVEIKEGLSVDSDVVVRSIGPIADGAEVDTSLGDKKSEKNPGH